MVVVRHGIEHTGVVYGTNGSSLLNPTAMERDVDHGEQR
jgi:hypothetical protein